MPDQNVPVVFAYVTASSLEEAERIGHTLVEERLAACANLLPGMRSIYRWQGAVEQAEEVVLIAKTRADRFDALAARVTALHSYETPCVVALPVSTGAAPYLAWIAGESDSASA